MLTDDEIAADFLLGVVEGDARVRQPDVVADPGDHRLFGIVVLVLDVADDGLDQILQGRQTVGAAVFVDHQGHLDARRLHLRHQVGGRHRRRYEQHRPNDPHVAQGRAEIDLTQVQRRAFGLERAGALGDVGHDVLDVDHADGVVEGLAVDRHARMAGLAKQLQQFRQRHAFVDGIDIGARDHDVVDAHFPQMQDIAQQPPLFRRERSRAIVLFGKGRREIFAQGPVGLEPDGRAQALEPSVLRPFGPRTRILGGLGTVRIRVLQARLGRAGTLWFVVHSS